MRVLLNGRLTYVFPAEVPALRRAGHIVIPAPRTPIPAVAPTNTNTTRS